LSSSESPGPPHRPVAGATRRWHALIRAEELFGFKELVTAEDDLPSLPSHLAQLGGIDSFYAARLVKHQ
jgi:16S rRNA (cytosine967-C5)-methyltransferase